MVWNTNISLITASATLSTSNDVYIVDATGGGFTITLPNITADGIMYKLIRRDNVANVVTVQGTGGQLIDGVATTTLKPNALLDFQSFNSAWYVSDTARASAPNLPLSYRFDVPNGGPLGTNSTSFVVVGTLIYGGTTFSNSIAQILTVLSATNTGTTGEIQLSDFTNGGNVIAITAFGPFGTAPDPQIIDLGAISNLPAGQAIFQIQLRKTSAGGGQPTISAIQITG